MPPAQLSEHLQSRFDVPVGFREYQIRRLYPCEIAAVDELLGGGFPRAEVSEISGNQAKEDETGKVYAKAPKAKAKKKALIEPSLGGRPTAPSIHPVHVMR